MSERRVKRVSASRFWPGEGWRRAPFVPQRLTSCNCCFFPRVRWVRGSGQKKGDAARGRRGGGSGGEGVVCAIKTAA